MGPRLDSVVLEVILWFQWSRFHHGGDSCRQVALWVYNVLSSHSGGVVFLLSSLGEFLGCHLSRLSVLDIFLVRHFSSSTKTQVDNHLLDACIFPSVPICLCAKSCFVLRMHKVSQDLKFVCSSKVPVVLEKVISIHVD